MNDPAIKVALAISVLLGGMFLATVFRPTLSAQPAIIPELNTPLSLQTGGQTAAFPPAGSSEAISKKIAEEASRVSSKSANGPTILTPLDPPQPVPNLPPSYPHGAKTNSARWGLPKELMPLVARQADGPLVHKVVDGDTLHDLALRYLGSAERAGEIFALNRDVLNNPKLLPIGLELKIPPRAGESR